MSPSSTNVTDLMHRLIDLENQLHRFDLQLGDGFTRLDSSWQRLNSTWDGHAYQVFSESWQKTRSMMRRYIELSTKYENFLKVRIEALEDAERGNL